MTARELIQKLLALNEDSLDKPVSFCDSNANLQVVRGVREIASEDDDWLKNNANHEGQPVLFCYEV